MLVTHDPVDAVVLADRMVVLEAGRVVQEGAPAEVSARPRTRFVADLVGVNLLLGSTADDGHVRLGSGHVLAVAGPLPAGEVAVAVRPQAVALARQEPAGSPRNRRPVTVAAVDPDRDRVRVVLDGPVPLTAEITHAALVEVGVEPGAALWASVKAVDVDAWPR